MTPSQFNRWIKPLRDRVLTMFTRGLVDSTDDSTQMQLVKVSLLDNELKEDVEHLHPYGLSSNCPTDGSETVIGCISGDRDSAVAVVVGNSKYRIKNLVNGEVCLYAKFGQTIMLKEDGSIEITPQSGKSLVIKSNVEIEGEVNASAVTATGDITSSGGDLIAGAITMKTHVHDGSTIVPTVAGAPGTNAGLTGVAQ